MEDTPPNHRQLRSCLKPKYVQSLQIKYHPYISTQDNLPSKNNFNHVYYFCINIFRHIIKLITKMAVVIGVKIR